jgi:hypothetical protein
METNKRLVTVGSHDPQVQDCYEAALSSTTRLVGRWESKGGAHVVELYKQDGTGYSWRTTGAGGYLGNHFDNDGEALAAFLPRLNAFQPARNKTPMRLVAVGAHDCRIPIDTDRAPRTVTCGGCEAEWCERCDPSPGPLCHTCHGRGYSTAAIKASRR